MKFYKYQGTGNDFILIDDRKKTFEINQEKIEQLCDRHFGIGADGLILLQNEENYDFRMVYFNADGREGSMCGNGGRCVVRFAEDLGIVKDQTKFVAVDGEHEAQLDVQNIHLKMGNVSEIEIQDNFYFLDTGSPHYVTWSENVANMDVVMDGKAIRYNDRFAQEGTNVNFVEDLGNNKIAVRTYERGVEDETLSCGTGVTAAAITAFLKGKELPILVQVLGGELKIDLDVVDKQHFQNITLIGAAKRVFEGEVDV